MAEPIRALDAVGARLHVVLLDIGILCRRELALGLCPEELAAGERRAVRLLDRDIAVHPDV
ncbi:hypothetical protein, partial [uncultured Selenomonas sp.]|uniref:hypothetical protein n=1 Tax=uncultured Selenomonas sp. TaxID=159275 RepID=UPI002590C36E